MQGIGLEIVELIKDSGLKGDEVLEFIEYIGSLDVGVCFEDFEKDMSTRGEFGVKAKKAMYAIITLKYPNNTIISGFKTEADLLSVLTKLESLGYKWKTGHKPTETDWKSNFRKYNVEGNEFVLILPKEMGFGDKDSLKLGGPQSKKIHFSDFIS